MCFLSCSSNDLCEKGLRYTRRACVCLWGEERTRVSDDTRSTQLHDRCSFEGISFLRYFVWSVIRSFGSFVVNTRYHLPNKHSWNLCGHISGERNFLYCGTKVNTRQPPIDWIDSLHASCSNSHWLVTTVISLPPTAPQSMVVVSVSLQMAPRFLSSLRRCWGGFLLLIYAANLDAKSTTNSQSPEEERYYGECHQRPFSTNDQKMMRGLR